MALILKFKVVEVVDEDLVEVYDATQNYIDSPNAGWGQDGNPTRAQRALLFYVEYIDEDGSATFLENINNLIGSNKLFALEDGTGLSDTDMSKFVVKSAVDGHHNFNFLILERDSTRVGGNQGDIYYNTDDNLPYYYDSSGWTVVSDSIISEISKISSQENRVLLDKRARKKLAEVTRDIYSVENGYDEKLRKERDDYSARLFMAKETFVSGNESSGRILLDNLKRYRF